MKKSIWLKNISLSKKGQAKELSSKFADVLIIGGGIAGMSVAYELMDQKLDALLIDKSAVGLGATSFSTGKVTFAHGLIYQQLCKEFGFAVAKKYLMAQSEAMKLVKKRVKDHTIACDFKRVPTYVFTAKEYNETKLNQEKVFYYKCNIKPTIENELPLSFPCKKALKINNQYEIQPYRYLMGLKAVLQKNHVRIHEYTKAYSFTEENGFYQVLTNQGIIRCKYLVVCTQYPFFFLPGLFFTKMDVEKGYLISRTAKPVKDFMAISVETDPVQSIRFFEGNLIYSSFNHKISTGADSDQKYQEISQTSLKLFKGQKLSVWQNQDVMTGDKLPYIGRVKDHLFVMTGFNKWGLTNATIGATVIRDLILQKKNKYSDLFDPNRKLNKNLLLDMIRHNASSMKNFAVGKAKFEKTCTHMGCGLCFNQTNDTYDCPCHGSQFTKEGKLIKGPATRNLNED